MDLLPTVGSPITPSCC